MHLACFCSFWELNSPMFPLSRLPAARGISPPPACEWRLTEHGWWEDKQHSQRAAVVSASSWVPRHVFREDQRVRRVSEIFSESPRLKQRRQKELCVQPGLQHGAGYSGDRRHWHCKLGTKISAYFSSWPLALNSH